MLSPVFWLSLVAVFWGMKWFAEGLMSLAAVELRVAQPARGEVVEVRAWREDAPPALDEAA